MNIYIEKKCNNCNNEWDDDCLGGNCPRCSSTDINQITAVGIPEAKKRYDMMPYIY